MTTNHKPNQCKIVHISDGFFGDVNKKGMSLHKWNSNATFALLALIQKHTPRFSDFNVKQKEVWSMVAEDMREQGFEVDGTQCDEKFRNLKKTYKKIRANHNSKGPEKWEFYSLMEELVGETLTTAEVLPPAVYESSQPKFIILSPGYEQITEHKPTLKSYSREQTVVFPSSNYDSDDNVGNVGKRKKRQRPTWFDDYLSELRRKEAARERRHKEKLEQREREINDKAVFRAEVLKILEKMVEDK